MLSTDWKWQCKQGSIHTAAAYHHACFQFDTSCDHNGLQVFDELITLSLNLWKENEQRQTNNHFYESYYLMQWKSWWSLFAVQTCCLCLIEPGSAGMRVGHSNEEFICSSTVKQTKTMMKMCDHLACKTIVHKYY